MLDDDISILEICTVVLERAGYQITTFSNADPILNGNFIEPDIFIIDKQLSGSEGADICHYLKNREHNKDTPVIIFSASTDLDKYAATAGADGFLEKPFQTKELRAIIEKHLRVHAANV